MGRLTRRERDLLADLAWAVATVGLFFLFVVAAVAAVDVAGDGWWSL